VDGRCDASEILSFQALANLVERVWQLTHRNLRMDSEEVGSDFSLQPTTGSISCGGQLREQARTRFGWNVEISTIDRYPQDGVTVSDAIAAVRNRPMVVAAAGEKMGSTREIFFHISRTRRLQGK